MLSSAEFTNVTDTATEKISASVLCLEKPFNSCVPSANRNSHSVAGTSEGFGMSHICAKVCTWNRLARFHPFCCIGAVVEGGRVKEFSTFCVQF